MPTILNPYLNFKDTTREVMNFYHGVFGGKLDMDTFADAHMEVDEDEQDHIMHAMLTTEGGMVLMASDTPKHIGYRPSANVSISLSGDADAELRDYFAQLSEGGTVTAPLEKAPWGDTFGMCTDKFGIQWMVNISPAQA